MPQQWLAAIELWEVQGHDFPSPQVPRAYPYGIYDLWRIDGFDNVGSDHDTGALAVAAMRDRCRYERQKDLSRGDVDLDTGDQEAQWNANLWFWKSSCEIAYETGRTCLAITVIRGKQWNKIEHRLFSFISSNWRGEPLRDYETVVNLIAKTTTAKGLKVTCRLYRGKYPTGRIITDKDMKLVSHDHLPGGFRLLWQPHCGAESPPKAFRY